MLSTRLFFIILHYDELYQSVQDTRFYSLYLCRLLPHFDGGHRHTFVRLNERARSSDVFLRERLYYCSERALYHQVIAGVCRGTCAKKRAGKQRAGDTSTRRFMRAIFSSKFSTRLFVCCIERDNRRPSDYYFWSFSQVLMDLMLYRRCQWRIDADREAVL